VQIAAAHLRAHLVGNAGIDRERRAFVVVVIHHGGGGGARRGGRHSVHPHAVAHLEVLDHRENLTQRDFEFLSERRCLFPVQRGVALEGPAGSRQERSGKERNVSDGVIATKKKKRARRKTRDTRHFSSRRSSVSTSQTWDQCQSFHSETQNQSLGLGERRSGDFSP
jgi:hypothetical protein